jgi:hypothetical protein
VARTFLIDAHNALFRLWDQPPTSGDAVRHAVVLRAKEALRRHGGGGSGPSSRASGASGATAHLVFDTAHGGRQRAGTHGRDGPVSWSYADGSADEEIVRLVREHEGHHGGGAISVVTDDRELRGRAAQLGAQVLRIHEWFSSSAEKGVTIDRRPSLDGPPLTAADFGLTTDAIDLGTDPDDV